MCVYLKPQYIRVRSLKRQKELCNSYQPTYMPLLPPKTSSVVKVEGTLQEYKHTQHLGISWSCDVLRL